VASDTRQLSCKLTTVQNVTELSFLTLPVIQFSSFPMTSVGHRCCLPCGSDAPDVHNRNTFYASPDVIQFRWRWPPTEELASYVQYVRLPEVISVRCSAFVAMKLRYFPTQSPSKKKHLSDTGISLKIQSWNKLGSCTRYHSRTAISAFSLP
jgi:hypothetical protein